MRRKIASQSENVGNIEWGTKCDACGGSGRETPSINFLKLEIFPLKDLKTTGLVFITLKVGLESH